MSMSKAKMYGCFTPVKNCTPPRWGKVSRGNKEKQKGNAKTNGDKIRTNTDEELAERMSRMANCMYCPVKCGIFCTEEECKAKWLSWLRSPVEESEK